MGPWVGVSSVASTSSVEIVCIAPVQASEPSARRRARRLRYSDCPAVAAAGLVFSTGSGIFMSPQDLRRIMPADLRLSTNSHSMGSAPNLTADVGPDGGRDTVRNAQQDEVQGAARALPGLDQIRGTTSAAAAPPKRSPARTRRTCRSAFRRCRPTEPFPLARRSRRPRGAGRSSRAARSRRRR